MNGEAEVTERQRLLLIEDDDVDALMFRRALVKHGLEVEVERAIDGVEALDRLSDASLPVPDLCVLDLNMPRVNGIEFLDGLRRHERLASMPVFVLTTSKAPHDVSEAYSHHVAGYFVKDVESSDLVGCMSVLKAWLPASLLPEHTATRLGVSGKSDA
ncbi:MAG: response regulator [Planctomycetes bacterium]|nr:response regulator [Planctomycetota bacterium]